jgi:hypothetical protein
MSEAPKIYQRCAIVPDETQAERLDRLMKVIEKHRTRVERGAALTVADYDDAIGAAVEIGQGFPPEPSANDQAKGSGA